MKKQELLANAWVIKWHSVVIYKFMRLIWVLFRGFVPLDCIVVRFMPLWFSNVTVSFLNPNEIIDAYRNAFFLWPRLIFPLRARVFAVTSKAGHLLAYSNFSPLCSPRRPTIKLCSSSIAEPGQEVIVTASSQSCRHSDIFWFQPLASGNEI